MKKFLIVVNLLLLSALLLNCKSVSNIVQNDILPSDEIYGKWEICIVKGNGHTVHSNICKTILFNKYGSGKLLLSDDLICKFNWKVEKEIITFSFKSADEQTDFLSGDLEYIFKLYDEGNLQYLEIKPKNKEIVYFLSRVKINK